MNWRLACLGFLASLPVLSLANAETCFRQCLGLRITSSATTDDEIRSTMRACREACEKQTAARLDPAAAAQLRQCRPEKLSLPAFRQLRAASPSFVVQSNAFTWDLRNVLPGKIIREVEVTTQKMDLSDEIMTARTLVLPGESETVLVSGFFDGYPNVRYATRVTGIWVCDGGG